MARYIERPQRQALLFGRPLPDLTGWGTATKSPANEFTLLIVAWLAAGIYALVFRESGNAPPPSPYFDRAAYFALFFARTWLLARAFTHDGLKIPYCGLLVFTLLFVVGNEWAQAAFTATHEGSVGDGIADMLGASAALWLAAKTAAVKRAAGRPSAQ